MNSETSVLTPTSHIFSDIKRFGQPLFKAYLTSNMPLHLRNLLGRSNNNHRTDLCRTYTLNSKERETQGYLCRSDWNWHNGWLLRMIQNALQESTSTDWQNWTVESEWRAIRNYHFEDLDMDDQALCVLYWRALSQLRSDLIHFAREEQLVPIQEVITQLWSFTQQAEQLYGVYPYTDILLGNVLKGQVFIHGSFEYGNAKAGNSHS